MPLLPRRPIDKVFIPMPAEAQDDTDGTFNIPRPTEYNGIYLQSLREGKIDYGTFFFCRHRTDDNDGEFIGRLVHAEEGFLYMNVFCSLDLISTPPPSAPFVDGPCAGISEVAWTLEDKKIDVEHWKVSFAWVFSPEDVDSGRAVIHGI
jgi:hypothetical protein